MKRVIPVLALVTLVPALSACGLRPVYGGGTSGSVAQALGHVEVESIPGKGGWLMRNALQDRLGALGQGQGPKYRLVVKLDDQIQGFGVRADDAVTRERRTLRARYQLVDEATGVQVIDDTAGSDVGIDVVSSEYSVIAAEDTALERLSQTVADQIVARLSRFAIKGSSSSAASAGGGGGAPAGQ